MNKETLKKANDLNTLIGNITNSKVILEGIVTANNQLKIDLSLRGYNTSGNWKEEYFNFSYDDELKQQVEEIKIEAIERIQSKIDKRLKKLQSEFDNLK